MPSLTRRMVVSKRITPLIILLLLALMALAPVPAGAQSKKSVENAEEAKERAYRELVEANEAVGWAISDLEAIEMELQDLSYTISRLDRKIEEFDQRVIDLRASAQEVVVEAYTNSGAGLVTAAFTAGSIQDLLTSQSLIGSAAARDLASLDLLAAVNRENDRLKAEVAVKRADVEVLEEKQVVVVEELSVAQEKADRVFAEAESKYKDVYAKYQAELKRKAAEDAARRAAAGGGAAGLPASATKGLVCPVAGRTYFVDTWGAPRPGGRTHKGVDMSGSMGQKLIAMQSGKVRLNWHSAGGRQVYVYGDDGIFYYYAHLSGYPAGLSNGDRVAKGQVVGYMGATGNASVVHLHFGMGPIGGGYVNPYPTVRQAC
ncbi:MAG: peptidoglycan DD-metalloendopeptidase family protein [Actinomycetota bacterium]